MILKRLTTVFAFHLCSSITMRTFMTTQIRKLCIWFCTKLDISNDFTKILSIKVTYFTFPWFDTRMDVSVLFQAGWCLKTFPAIITCIKSIFTFTCFTWIRSIGWYWPIANPIRTIVHAKTKRKIQIHYRRILIFLRFLLHSEVVKRHTFSKLNFDWLNMNRSWKKKRHTHILSQYIKTSLLIYSLVFISLHTVLY